MNPRYLSAQQFSRLPPSTTRPFLRLSGSEAYCSVSHAVISRSFFIIPYNREMQDEDYMTLAINEAIRASKDGEVPIGAVVVYAPVDSATRKPLAEPRIIAKAGNLRETTNDPAGHAEFLALKQAARELDTWRLTGCTVYVTLEPCIMCAGLMHQSRIDRCVYGARDPKAGALGSLYEIHADERLNHTFEVRAGVKQDICAQLLKDFFAKRRAQKKGTKADASR